MIASQLREPLRRALAGEAAEWPPLDERDAAALIEQGMAPLIYAAARVPQLHAEALRVAAAEPLRLEDARRVSQALADRGVQALILKGTALAYDLYAQPEHRPRADTDLLIARDALPIVREVFRELGFVEQITSGDEHGLRQLGFSRTDRFGVAHLYDVHWAVANSPLFADVLRIEDIEPVALSRIDANAYGLSRVDALLLACIHRVAHHHDDERLIWLADIALLRSRMITEEHRQFWEHAAEGRVLAVCRRSIEVAENWFGGEPVHAAERFLTPAHLAQDEPSRLLLDRDVTYARATLADLLALPWSARLTRLRQLAFPPRAFMQEAFATRSAMALPWLYVYRGARGVARLFRRAADL